MPRKPARWKLAADLNEALAAIQTMTGLLPESVATSRIQGRADVAALLEEGLLDNLRAAVDTARELLEDLDGM